VPNELDFPENEEVMLSGGGQNAGYRLVIDGNVEEEAGGEDFGTTVGFNFGNCTPLTSPTLKPASPTLKPALKSSMAPTIKSTKAPSSVSSVKSTKVPSSVSSLKSASTVPVVVVAPTPKALRHTL
jgi:hypothetical protein